MYSLSIIWMIVMFALITIAKNEQKIAIKQTTGFNRRLSVSAKPVAQFGGGKVCLILYFTLCPFFLF